MPTNQRLDYIDMAKGSAIALMVFGHTFSTYQNTPIMVWIYSFHMPVFFFLSGFMISRQKVVNSGQRISTFVQSRACRLLVPYAIIGFCYAPFKILLSKFANKPYDVSTIWQMLIGINPDGELWFLYALFVMTMIAAVFSFRVSLIGLLAAVVVLIWNPWHIVTNFLFFFLLGIYIKRKHKNFIELIMPVHIVVLAVIAFIVGNYCLNVLKVHSFFLLTGISGMVITFSLSFWLSRLKSPFSNLFEYWGILSMDIYILSDIIKIPFRIIFWNMLHFYTLSFIICTTMAMVCSVWISKYIVRRNKFLKFLVLGMRK